MLPKANLSTSWLSGGNVVFHVEYGPGECTRKWVHRFARLPVPTGKSNNNFVTNLIRATNYLGYFVSFVALGF